MHSTTLIKSSAYALGLFAVVMVPAIPVYAVGEIFETTNTILAYVLFIVQQLTNIAFAAILLFFFYGLARFILGGAEDKKVARNMMIWAVIALFVAASIWGIVRLLRASVGVDDSTTGTVPHVELP